MRSRATSGELRRRRYVEPQARLAWPPQEITDSAITPAPNLGSLEPEVFMEGPLQQRTLLLFWSWRWCVLDSAELRIYTDQEARQLEPERPLAHYSIAKLHVTPDLYFPCLLVVTDAELGEPVTYLRSGCGQRWEENVAASLWLHGFSLLTRVQRMEGEDESEEMAGSSPWVLHRGIGDDLCCHGGPGQWRWCFD